VVNVPPYCGLPRLSHQLPLAAVVVDIVVVGVVGMTVVVDVVVRVDVDVGVDVDVVDVAQDAKTSDVTMRHVSTIQIAAFFIYNSFYFLNIHTS